MRSLTWKLAIGAVAVAATAVVTPFAMAAGAADKTADGAGSIQVYNDNVENLPTAGLKCHGDWKDLVYYMKTSSRKPDVFLVHQLDGQKQLDQLIGTMEKTLGEDYAGMVSDKTPKKMGSPCGKPKQYQTNAVIYRTARFDLLKSKDNNWQAQAQNSKGECVDNHQARTEALKLLLKDKVSGKNVTAASVHWPTGDSGGPPCADSNAREVAKELTADGYGGDLRIVGGDFNYTATSGGTDYRGWYKSLNGDLGGKFGLRDVVYDKCAASDDKAKCLKNNWTVNSGARIDFMFAAKPGGLPKVTATHTVSYNEGDAADRKVTGSDRGDRDYSSHRAVHAQIHY